MKRSFDFRTESYTRYKYWKKVLEDKGIHYEQRTLGITTDNAVYVLTIEAEDDLKYENESEVSDWELCDDNLVNLKYICGLLCIPYEQIKFVYSE